MFDRVVVALRVAAVRAGDIARRDVAQGVEQAIDVARVVVEPEADADHARCARACPRPRPGRPIAAVAAASSPSRWATYGWAQKQPLRTRDAVLVAEDRGDEPVVEPSTVNGMTPIVAAGSPDRRRGRRRIAGQPVDAGAAASACSCATMRLQPELGERATAAAANATAPSRLGVPASSRSRQVGPHDLVERDGIDRAAAAVVGRAAEAVPVSDERAAPERCVQLVRRQGDEVEVLGVVVRPHVDRPVRGELGGVDEDPPAGGVHPLGQVVDRRDDAGDVRGAGHGEQRDPAGVAGEELRRGGRGRATRPPRTRTWIVAARARHGRSLEWCSSTVVTTTSPSAIGIDRASLLIASVVFFVNTTVSARVGAEEPADRRAAPPRRPRSSVATWWPAPRCTLAVVRQGPPRRRRVAARIGGVVAALSRLT